MGEIQLRWFQITIATSRVNANHHLLWDVADNSINYCSNDLKKLLDIPYGKNYWADSSYYSDLAVTIYGQ